MLFIQCAWFQTCSMTSYAKVILQEIKAYLVGNWNKPTAESDVSTAQSRSGYIILFAACPLTWVSRLQTEIALSTTEAEYIAFSTAVRDVISIINLLKELKAAWLSSKPSNLLVIALTLTQ